MLCKLLSLAMVALITTLALALPTDKDLITLQTDDTSKLSQLNILPILDFLDTEDSHNMSYDKCGLKLAGVHFNYTSPNLSNLTLTHTDIEAVTAWCGTSTCATANTRQWANAMQPRVIPAPACGFIAQNAKTSTVLVRSLAFIFNNARCLGDIKCNLVVGVTYSTNTNSEANLNALVGQCNNAMVQVANDCAGYGGNVQCHSNGDFIYYMYPQDLATQACDKGWAATIKCGTMTCSAADGFCQSSD